MGAASKKIVVLKKVNIRLKSFITFLIGFFLHIFLCNSKDKLFSYIFTFA